MLKPESSKGASPQMANFENNHLKISDFRAALSWYEAMGVNIAISETPTNWLDTGKKIDQSWAQPQTLKKPSPPQKAGNQTQQPPDTTKHQSPATVFLKDLQSEEVKKNTNLSQNPAHQNSTPAHASPALKTAQNLAKTCKSLAELKTTLTEFEDCALKRTAKNLVFSRGPETAPLMIIGEAPGRDEDIVGKPFVGRAGKLLDDMLKAIDLDEQHTHITNIVYWRPPGNRTPTQEESNLCRPFLDRQIELVAPKLILILGGAAAKQLYNTTAGITKLRGTWKKIPGNRHQMQAMATLHPAYLLRTPIAKRMVWQDLQQIRKKLAEFE